MTMTHVSRRDYRAYQKALERKWADRLVARLSGETLVAYSKPDVDVSRKMPDYAYRGSDGQEYIVEVTRMLTPDLRRIEGILTQKVCNPLEGALPGTFVLAVSLDVLGSTGITRAMVRQLSAALRDAPALGAMERALATAPWFAVRQIDGAGSRLIPWITAADLPYDVCDDHPQARVAEATFRSVVVEAAEKFSSYHTGERRILLISLSQTGIDVEYHARDWSGRDCLMVRWVARLPASTAQVDEVYVQPGVTVWEGDSSDDSPIQVRAGHRYVDDSRSIYVRLRPGPLRWL